MRKSHIIIAGVTLPFAVAATLVFDYHHGQRMKAAIQKSQASDQTLRDKYDREVIPALLGVTLDICGDREAKMHGLLGARMIFDSNVDDDVRAFLKSKKVDPHHYGSYQMPTGDGLMGIENAHKLAAFLIKNNIALTAEPDRHKGQRQAEYLNDGSGRGRLVIYFQPAPSDYDGKDKPWILAQNKQIPPDGIYVPMSAALGTFLNDIMNGKYTDTAVYRVTKAPGTGDGWTIQTEKLVMDGPAAPERLRPPSPATN